MTDTNKALEIFSRANPCGIKNIDGDALTVAAVYHFLGMLADGSLARALSPNAVVIESVKAKLKEEADFITEKDGHYDRGYRQGILHALAILSQYGERK